VARATFTQRRSLLLKSGVVYTSSLTSFQRKTKALWNILSEAGRSVGIANWWVTYPAEAVAGFNISDHANYWRMKLRANLARRNLDISAFQTFRQTVYPPQTPEAMASWHSLDQTDLLRRARSFVRIDDQLEKEFCKSDTFRRDKPLSVLRFSIFQDEFALNAFGEMLKRQHSQPDLLAIYFGGLDAVSHSFWKYAFPDDFEKVSPHELERYGQTLHKYYCWMDEVVGSLMALVDRSETAIIVLSDHGFESAPPEQARSGVSGSHDNAPDGVLFLAGPNVKSGKKLDGRSIDIAPTALYLMGLPVGRDMPGRVLNEALSEQYLAQNPVSLIDSWESSGIGIPRSVPCPLDESVDKKVLERLKALGYFD